MGKKWGKFSTCPSESVPEYFRGTPQSKGTAARNANPEQHNQPSWNPNPSFFYRREVIDDAGKVTQEMNGAFTNVQSTRVHTNVQIGVTTHRVGVRRVS